MKLYATHLRERKKGSSVSSCFYDVLPIHDWIDSLWLLSTRNIPLTNCPRNSCDHRQFIRVVPMASNVQTLQNEVNQLRISFDAVRDDVVTKLNQCSDHIKTAESRSQLATEMNAVLENKLANASNEEKEWKDIRVKLATTAINGKVILDVGGKKYSTSVETLTREKNTFFTALFSTQWKLDLDPEDKSIFIDRDGKLFRHILTYFRTGKIPLNVVSDESLRQSLIIEAEYFRLHGLISIVTEQRRMETFFSDGTLGAGFKVKLYEFCEKKDKRWVLIYRASRDGFGAAAFHSRCDNRGPTITIIQSKDNYLFGGYTAIPWTSDGSYKEDSTAFLFTLSNPHDIPPTKYSINPAQSATAVYHYPASGPSFGGGQDMRVTYDMYGNNFSSIHFPRSYIDTTGKGENTFTGASNFIPSDIEVYSQS